MKWSIPLFTAKQIKQINQFIWDHFYRTPRRETWEEQNIRIAQNWCAEHGLPQVSDEEAVQTHFSRHWFESQEHFERFHAEHHRRRLNSRSHMARLLEAWSLWTPKSKTK